MTISTGFQPTIVRWTDLKTYWLAIIFIAGNILLPQLCHFVPSGGRVLLPIYFFTLIGAYKFGLNVGLLTALLSPLVNHWFFGMPPAAVLPIIIIKSTLLAISAAFVATRFRRLSIFHLLLVVLLYQLIGSLIEWVMTGSLDSALQDLTMGAPGMILQVIGGFLILRILRKDEQ